MEGSGIGLTVSGQAQDLGPSRVFSVEEGGRLFRNLIPLSLCNARFCVVARQRRNKLVSPVSCSLLQPRAASCSDLWDTYRRASFSTGLRATIPPRDNVVQLDCRGLAVWHSGWR